MREAHRSVRARGVTAHESSESFVLKGPLEAKVHQRQVQSTVPVAVDALLQEGDPILVAPLYVPLWLLHEEYPVGGCVEERSDKGKLLHNIQPYNNTNLRVLDRTTGANVSSNSNPEIR